MQGKYSYLKEKVVMAEFIFYLMWTIEISFLVGCFLFLIILLFAETRGDRDAD